MSEVEKLNQIVRKENRFCKKGKSVKGAAQIAKKGL
jgi:hypothetical protein